MNHVAVSLKLKQCNDLFLNLIIIVFTDNKHGANQ